MSRGLRADMVFLEYGRCHFLNIGKSVEMTGAALARPGGAIGPRQSVSGGVSPGLGRCRGSALTCESRDLTPESLTGRAGRGNCLGRGPRAEVKTMIRRVVEFNGVFSGQQIWSRGGDVCAAQTALTSANSSCMAARGDVMRENSQEIRLVFDTCRVQISRRRGGYARAKP